MTNILDKMNSKWRTETLDELKGILISQNPWIEEGIKNGRLIITEDTEIYRDLDMEELEIAEFVGGIEKKYNIKIPSYGKFNIGEMLTIGGYMDYLAKEEILNRR